MLLAALISLIVCTGGCVSAPAESMADALRDAPHAATPTGLTLAVAPLEIDPRAASVADDQVGASAIEPDAAGLRADLLAAVTASGAFARVVALDARAPLDHPAVLDAAFAHPSHPDLLLTLRVRRHEVAFVRRNGLWATDMALWLLFVWPPALIADEVYSGTITIEADLRAVGAETPIWSQPLVLSSTIERDLYMRDRGAVLAGIVRIPGALAKDNYDAIAACVLPHARNNVARQLAGALAGLRREDVEPRLAQRLAVVVGVGRQSAIDENRHATDDAGALLGVLTSATGMAVPRRNIELIVDADATKERILLALARRAARAVAADTLVLYFSGFGFTAGGEGYLAPFGFDPADPAGSAISFAELRAVLDGCRAHVAIVLDTSLGGGSETGRTMPRRYTSRLASSPGGSSATTDGGASALEKLAVGRVVLIAAGPGSGAGLVSPVGTHKKGLFTIALVDSAARAATDADNDGWISLGELFESARNRTVQVSSRFGATQSPALFGGADAARMLLLRRPPE